MSLEEATTVLEEADLNKDGKLDYAEVRVPPFQLLGFFV